MRQLRTKSLPAAARNGRGATSKASASPPPPPKSSLAFGLTFAVLSLSSQIGKGLQKEALDSLPEMIMSQSVIAQYFQSPRWLLGLVLDIGGAIFGLVSLSSLPISVAQPIFCNGLTILVLFAYFYLREPLRPADWAAVALCIGGTSALALTLEAHSLASDGIAHLQVRLLGTLILVPAALFGLELLAANAKKSARGPLVEGLTGTQAGLCIGVGNASLAAGLQTLALGLPTVTPLQLVFAAVFAACGIGLTASHPVFANRGYKHGRVVIITAYITLVSMVGGVLVGVAVLGEPWPTDPTKSALRLAALGAIGGAILLLNVDELRASCSTTVRFTEVQPSETQ